MRARTPDEVLRELRQEWVTADPADRFAIEATAAAVACVRDTPPAHTTARAARRARRGIRSAAR